MELGIVSFFNVARGFGRIRTEALPQGVFVHFSDVLGQAKILVEHELVKFQVAQTRRGPRAKQVERFSPRLQGQILVFEKGYGKVADHQSEQRYFLHHTDVLGQGFKRIEPGFRVEFSPFTDERGLQAKEVVISDTRSPLEQFAELGEWETLLAQLASLARPENWDFPHHPQGNHPVLDNYLQQVFRRVQTEKKVAVKEGTIAAFNTGLLTVGGEEIFACLAPQQPRAHPAAYLSPPCWQVLRFATGSDRLLLPLGQLPTPAQFVTHPVDLVFDPNRRIVPDVAHIVEERAGRFPASLQALGQAALADRLRHALRRAEQWVRRDLRLAVPQYYQGQVQLLLPLCLEQPGQVDLVAVIAPEGASYRATTVLPLDWAYQNARLLAPHPQSGWLWGN